MATVNSEAQTLTMSDGYVMEYNIYYEDSSGQVPLLIFFHAAGGDRSTMVSQAKTMRNNGFTTVTMDRRGHGDGGGSDGDDWIDDNGHTNSDYGWGLYAMRDLLDFVELMYHVNSGKGAYIEFSKIGVLGTSGGGAIAWMMAGLGIKNTYLGGMPVPKISALSVRNFLPKREWAVSAPSRNLLGHRTPNITGKIWAGFEDNTAKKTILASNLELLQDTLDTGDAYQLRDVSIGRTVSGSNSDTLLNLYRHTDELAERLPRDFPILAIHDCDDHWGAPNQLVDLLSHRENAFGIFGASGGHAATEVDGEVARIEAKQLAFFRYYLKGEDTLASGFGSSSPTACPKAEMLVTPNNATDYADEDPPPYTDTTYSWTKVTAEKLHWLRAFGDEDLNNVASTPTTIWIQASTLSGSAPSGSDWTTTITNTWGTATTAEDVGEEIEAGDESAADIDDYYNGRLSVDTDNFQMNWTSGHEATFLGIAQGHFYLSSSQAGAQVYVKIQHSSDSGSNWMDVADTWYTFPEDYVANDIRQVNLEFSLRAMHLLGASGGVKLLRLQFSNYARFDVPQVDGKDSVRIHPCFDNNTVTLYHGETYLSRVVLPLHSDTTFVFEP